MNGRMHLLLGDISVGAKTPGMVAAVDRWRNGLKEQGKLGTHSSLFAAGPCCGMSSLRSHEDGTRPTRADDSAWTRLAELNERMIGLFKQINVLADERREVYTSALARLASLPVDQVNPTMPAQLETEPLTTLITARRCNAHSGKRRTVEVRRRPPSSSGFWLCARPS
jgi:hypothetical protein